MKGSERRLRWSSVHPDGIMIGHGEIQEPELWTKLDCSMSQQRDIDRKDYPSKPVSL